MRAFEAVTGPKIDRWLVKTVGMLVVANAIAVAAGARRRVPSPETVALALCDALAFTTIDVTYVLRRRISPIYLADAVVELALGAAIALGD